MLFTLILLALVGFLISSYFTAISYGWIEPDAAWIPSFCRMGERTCAAVVFSPRARVFGIPNSVLGQLFYAALIAGVLGNFLLTKPFYFFYLFASLLTVLLGVFLTYSLLFLTRLPCKLCFTSHGINFVIFILLVTRLRSG
ncbi:vitamin K epoxide reductase family protein [Acidobacteria bacterium AH-259-A15]|nr:vitamin K epoxide reductase family protein [Acidobacteria bacterium AH-259-A15]